MYRIQAKIRSCYHLANTIRLLLDEALDLANDADYDPHWIAAINTAKNDNLKVWHHTYNVATCIDPTAPLPRSQEVDSHDISQKRSPGPPPRNHLLASRHEQTPGMQPT